MLARENWGHSWPEISMPKGKTKPAPFLLPRGGFSLRAGRSGAPSLRFRDRFSMHNSFNLSAVNAAFLENSHHEVAVQISFHYPEH